MKFLDNLPWSRSRIYGLLILLLVLGVWAYLQRDHLSRQAILDFGRGLPAGWFIAAFMVLPLLGIPISLFLILAGVRFGFGWGAVLVSTGVFFHNFMAYHFVHGRFRAKLAKKMSQKGHRIPTPKRENRIWFTIGFVALQGPPYAVKLYLLALTDIPFRIYFWCGAPVYIIFCMIPLLAGSTAMAVNPIWIYVGIFGITGLGLGLRWLKRRISEKGQGEF